MPAGTGGAFSDPNVILDQLKKGVQEQVRYSLRPREDVSLTLEFRKLPHSTRLDRWRSSRKTSLALELC